MKRIIIQEIKQITTQTEVMANDALEAMKFYKHNKEKTKTLTVNEDTNITIAVSREEKE